MSAVTTADERWLPSGAKVQLLRVGLDPVATVDDFAEVHRSVTVDEMDWSFAELLPLFARRWEVDDGRIGGIRKRHFYANSITMARINEAVAVLADSGVGSVLGGGLAALQLYPDLSCRSLPDAELIVAAGDLQRARDSLVEAGWRADEFDRLSRDNANPVRLTSRLRGTAPGLVTRIDEIDTRTTTLTGQSLPIVSPAVAVVEIAVAALWPRSEQPIRWIVDLDLLMSEVAAEGQLDTVVRHARTHGAAQLVRVALQHARRLGARSVPAAVLRQLALGRTTRVERTAVMARAGIRRTAFWVGRVSCR